MRRAYLFEAKGIQRWVLEGGRLRDIAAGSAVLAGTARSDADDLLAKVLDQAVFNPTLSRRAGGAFMLHFDAADEAAFHRFRALWRLAFSRLAPGLEFSEALGDPGDLRPGDDPDVAAGAAAYAPRCRLAVERQNSQAGLPPFGHPLAVLARRVGRPMIERGGRFDPAGEEGLDVTLAARRRAWKAMPDRPAKIMGRDLTAMRDDDGRSRWPDLNWPDRMEDDGWTDGVVFPFHGADPRIAVIHADISGLGDFYARVRDTAATLTRPTDFMLGASAAIEEAVAAAVAGASAAALTPVNVGTDEAPDWVAPARPVLIGGDDVTVIVRADFAMCFAQAFLERLEDETLNRLQTFCKQHAPHAPGVAVALTAACGVAVGGPKQPFFRLLRLAEDLCGAAKRRSKAMRGQGGDAERPASVIAFHRVTESALAAGADDLAGRVTRETVVLADGPDDRAGRGVTEKFALTAQPYRVGKAGGGEGLPRLDGLAALKAALDHEDLKAGRLREMRGLWLTGQDVLVGDEWVRWRKVARRRHPAALDEFDAKLKAVSGLEGEPATWDDLFKGGLALNATPLFDALEWRAFS